MQGERNVCFICESGSSVEETFKASKINIQTGHKCRGSIAWVIACACTRLQEGAKISRSLSFRIAGLSH